MANVGTTLNNIDKNYQVKKNSHDTTKILPNKFEGLDNVICTNNPVDYVTYDTVDYVITRHIT